MVGLKACLLLAAVTQSLGEKSSYGQMGMTELLQMRDDLKARLNNGVRINDTERDTWQMFKDLITNTSLVYIEGEFDEQGTLLNNSWDTVETCSSDLTEDKLQWPGKRTSADDKNGDHNTCRNNQPDPECNRTCTRCEDFASTLLTAQSAKGAPPTGAVPTTTPVFEACTANDDSCWGNFGNDNHNTTIYNWFKDYHDWHCAPHGDCPLGASGTHSLTALECWQNCTQECDNEIAEYGNNESDCDDEQDDFENALCDFYSTLRDDCATYTVCRSGANGDDGADQDYLDKKSAIKTLEERLVVEYQIMKTIICYIDLLLRPNSEAITEGDKTACEVYYPMPIPTLAIYYPDEYAPYNNGWQTVNCECDNFPNAATCSFGSSSAPGYQHYSERIPNLNNCTAFEDHYYKNQGWYGSVGSECTTSEVNAGVQSPVYPTPCTAQRAIDRGCASS